MHTKPIGSSVYEVIVLFRFMENGRGAIDRSIRVQWFFPFKYHFETNISAAVDK